MINYSLIGTIPEVEQFRNTLPAMIVEYQGKTTEFNEHTPRQERLALSELAGQITDCAQHFYGLDPEYLDTMDELIDAIQSLDQQLEF